MSFMLSIVQRIYKEPFRLMANGELMSTFDKILPYMLCAILTAPCTVTLYHAQFDIVQPTLWRFFRIVFIVYFWFTNGQQSCLHISVQSLEFCDHLDGQRCLTLIWCIFLWADTNILIYKSKAERFSSNLWMMSCWQHGQRVSLKWKIKNNGIYTLDW